MIATVRVRVMVRVNVRVRVSPALATRLCYYRMWLGLVGYLTVPGPFDPGPSVPGPSVPKLQSDHCDHYGCATE